MVASIVLATIVSAPAVMAQAGDSEGMANLVIQVQELQDEVRMLRGRLEEQATELENLKRRQRDQYLDLDRRISDIRNGLPIGAGAPGVAAGGPEVTTSGSTEPGPVVSPSEDVPEVRAPMQSQSQVSTIDQPVVQSQAAPVSAAEEKAAYDQAFQALKELRYADAAEDFQIVSREVPTTVNMRTMRSTGWVSLTTLRATTTSR